jgi:16S rRNA (guanine527-N7)-methyltransferase
LNLTRIHNFSNMVLKLYVDSILPGRLMDLPPSLLDLGTGPGMPGIPLKIVYPHLDMTLAESRGKRVDFLKMAVDRLKLENITVIGKTITSAFETPVQGVITRAVEDIGITLDRVSGCLASGGQAIFMKGPECEAEVKAAMEKFDSRFRLARQIDYQIPHTSHARRLIVFQRIDEPLRERRATAMSQHPCRVIESEQNSIFKDLKKLLSGRGIKKQRKALISGSKQVAEVLRDSPEQCLAWITTGHQQPPPAGAPAQVTWYQLTGPLFKTIDVIGTDAPILLVKTPDIKQWTAAEGLPPGCSVLVPFQDPENVGALIRSAVAFGVDNIILLSECAHPFHPKALRASGGVILKANLLEGPALKDIPGNLPVIALSREGKDISTIAFPRTFAFLPGIEGQGLPLHLRDRAVAIPIRETVESLNAATATAIAFYVWAQAG